MVTLTGLRKPLGNSALKPHYVRPEDQRDTIHWTCPRFLSAKSALWLQGQRVNRYPATARVAVWHTN